MLFVVAIALLLAFANGANDNFKGVATLFGSGAANYRRALGFATLTTALGSAAAVLLAGGLLACFQGKGIVAPELVGEPGFVGAVASGASLTVLLATRLGMPTSTTHALIGALIGGGLASGEAVAFGVLGEKLLLPLLASPLLAIAATAAAQPLLRRARVRLESSRTSGFRVAGTSAAVARAAPVEATAVLDCAHYLSAGAMSFARGLNDTPKIAALLLVLPSLAPAPALLLTGIAIGLGGWVAARRVATTMSERITPMDASQGLTANLVSTTLILGASRFGMPVSTTHVSCGSIFGLGFSAGGANARVVRSILLSWLVTLPLAGGIAALARIVGG